MFSTQIFRLSSARISFRSNALGAAALFAGALPVSADVDVPDLIRSTASTYAELESYKMSGTMKIEMDAGGRKQTIDAPLILHGRPPHEQRVEIDHAQMGSIWVGTSAEVVTYMKPMKRFMRFQAEQLQNARAELRRMGPARYAELGADAAQMTFVDNETLSTPEGDVACVRIAAPTDLAEAAPGLDVVSYTLWVDPVSHLVRQERVVASGKNPQMGVDVKMDQTISYNEIVLNESLDDALFAFVPPPGVTETTPDQLSGGSAPKSELTGNPAVPFELTALSGERISLADLKGKVVLVDFWATWCGPCRREMPHVQKLYNEHSDDGFVVLAVSQEREPTVRAFIEKAGFTFPTLVDTDGAVNRAYGVSALPTLVVINRDGIVSDHLVGLRSEATLRSALERAGL